MDKPVALLHIPKTGGTYVTQRVGGVCDSPHDSVISPLTYLGHVCLTRDMNAPVGKWESRLPKRLSTEYCITSIVRNPYRWLVSGAIHWGAVARPDGRRANDDDRRHFKAFIDGLCATEPTAWPSRGLLFRQLWSDDGECMCHWLNRTETLDSDVSALAARAGLTYTPAPKLRVQGVVDYDDYYSYELRALVYETWQRDFLLFGYDTNSVEADIGHAVLKHDISACSVRYDHATDTLHWNA